MTPHIILLALLALAMIPAPLLVLLFLRLRKQPEPVKRLWGRRVMIAGVLLGLAFMVPTAIVRRDATQVLPFAFVYFGYWAAFNRKFNPRWMVRAVGFGCFAVGGYGFFTTLAMGRDMIANPIQPVWLGWTIVALLAALSWLGIGAGVGAFWFAGRTPATWEPGAQQDSRQSGGLPGR